MRRKPRVDANHAEIAEYFRKAGCSVLSLAGVGRGCPDLAVGYHGATALIEVKDGSKCPSQRRLTDDEYHFHQDWRGGLTAVVDSIDSARALLLLLGGRAEPAQGKGTANEREDVGHHDS